MTTQNTHHEHNDVDQSVVEYPSTSDAITGDSTTSTKKSSPETQSEATYLVKELAGIHVASNAEQDISVPSPSNQINIQTQEPSQNPVSPEMAGSSTNLQATLETSLLHKAVAYGEEVFQAKIQLDTTPDVVQAKDDETVTAEVEQNPLLELVSDDQTTTADTQSKPLSISHEEKYIETEPNKREDVADSGEKPTPTEIQLPETTSQTEEAQTGAEKIVLPIASPSVDIQVTAQQSEQALPQPEALSEPREGAPLAMPVSETDKVAVESESASEAPSSFPYTEIAPLINTTAEEVRPFTKFIEEFRLAEAARLQSALRESQVEAFALLNSVETVSSENTSTEKPATSENGADTETKEGTSMHAEAKQTINTEPQDTPVTEQKAPVNPANRPVSPLLRPATRLRVPRHGLVRHTREEQPIDEATLPPVQKAPAEVKEPGATLSPVPTSEPVSPKPARRYRFDRPSSNAKNKATAPSDTTTSALPNENVSPAVPAAKTDFTQERDTREVPSNGLAHSEPSAPAQEQVETTSDAKALPEPPIIPMQTSEQGRRRPMHMEQVAPTTLHSVVASPPPIGEPVTNTEEIAPEDLPPLEYAELQKANSSRRRRRHRSSTGSIAGGIVNIGDEPAASTTPVPPSPLLASMPQVPASSPIQPPATNGAYNIVSGYTLNQMNQGNEIVGPFMAPEPSPARGSVLSRDSRAARAESQRPPIGPSSFASRSADHGLHGPSAASMTQFANIVSQAIQAQTDRMVAELRRANQAPANVSVNLPPFPSTERVGVFVDVANLLYSARTLRIAVDFGKLLDFLRGNRRLVRAHAYCPTSPQPGDEQMFLQAVKGLGYRITTKNYKTFSSGAKKADLDLDLCMDVVRLVDGRAVDCIVLVSGDSDFMPMLDYCSDHGVRVEVAAFDEAMSATLRQSCDLFVNLSMLEEIRA